MKRVQTFCYCILLASVLLCPWAIASTRAPPYIKIGTLYATSGAFTAISTSVHNGLDLWVKRVNADGGVFVKPYGKKIPIKLISYNDQSSTTTAATLYNHLITQDHVDILVSDATSVLTSVAVPIAEEHKMLLFDQAGTSAKFFSPGNPYIVQLNVAVSPIWAKPLAEFFTGVAAKHGIHRVAILYATNDFTGPQADYLRKFIDRKSDSGVQVVYDRGVPTSTTSYPVLLRSIEASKPDAVVELGYPRNDISFLRDLQSTGVKFRMVFASYPGLATWLIKKNVGISAMLNVFTYATPLVLSYRPDIGMNVEQFRSAYRDEYGQHTKIGINAIWGYNTGITIQKVLETTKGMSQLALRAAVFALSGKLTTIDGHFRLNEDGAQVGMLLPVGQIQQQPNGGGIAVVPLYPS